MHSLYVNSRARLLTMGADAVNTEFVVIQFRAASSALVASHTDISTLVKWFQALRYFSPTFYNTLVKMSMCGIFSANIHAAYKTKSA